MSDPVTKSYIESFETPAGTEYFFKDADLTARVGSIESSITGAMHYKGITTTVLTDGSTTATISIDGDNVTFTSSDAGSVVIYDEKEYVWNGSKWQEFGSTGSLKALAFKDSATGSYTPSGSVSQPTFSGTEGNISVTGTPAGSISATNNASGNYQPAGSVGAPTISVSTAGSTTSVTPIASVGTLPSLSATVTGTKLTLSFDAGSLPTKGTAVDVKTSDATYTASQPTFTGTKVQLAFSGNSLTSTGTYTPSGTVSQPSFSGTGGSVTVS